MMNLSKIRGFACVAAVVFMACPAQAEWEDPKTLYGQDWTCDRMYPSDLTYNDCKKCESQGGHFYWREGYRDVAHCTLPSTPETTAPSTKLDEKPKEYYGALALGIGRKGKSTMIAAGECLNKQTSAEAAECAVKGCQKEGISCNVLDTFTGCGYLTVGKNVPKRQVGWGKGPTKEEAIQRCLSQGLKCNLSPIGGCNLSAEKK